MNKAEGKYFNTAMLMNQALLYLLEKQDFETITIKAICQKAGVNRSTFYLHYDTIDDLLEETIYNLNKEFINTFAQTNIAKNIHPKTEEDYVFIKSEYLQPYLNFVKENKRILKVIHHKPHLFKVNSAYEKMCDKIFYPAMRSFNISPEKEPYIFEYFTKGVVAIINKWIELDCKLEIPALIQIIMDCVNYKN